MFSRIQNPETGKWVNVNGSAGQKILKNYLKQSGGAITSSDLYSLNQTIEKVNTAMNDLKSIGDDEKPIDQVIQGLDDLDKTKDIAAAAAALFMNDAPLSQNSLSNLSDGLSKLKTKLEEYMEASDQKQATTDDGGVGAAIQKNVDGLKTGPK